jgi:mycofactocin precursor
MRMGEYVTVPASAVDRPEEDQADAGPLATDELLVEEVSIDGMCGVY